MRGHGISLGGSGRGALRLVLRSQKALKSPRGMQALKTCQTAFGFAFGGAFHHVSAAAGGSGGAWRKPSAGAGSAAARSVDVRGGCCHGPCASFRPAWC